MNINVSSKALATALLMLAVFWMGGSCPSIAADAFKALDVQVSLLTSPKIVLGEPITLHYVISNISDQKIGAHWGEEEWYSLDLTDESGKTNTFVAPKPKAQQAGFRVIPDPFVTAGRQVKGFLTVTQRLTVSHPGNYTLTVHVRLPYTVVAAGEENPVNADNQIKSENNVFSQDHTFRLSVAPADESILQARAASLVRAVSTDNFGPAFQADMDALFSMPEAQAASSWMHLANNASKADAELIAVQLARVHSIKTVDILAQMLDSPALSYDEKAFIRTKLDESYNAGDAMVKEHIKAMAASRGGTMPERVTIPQPSD